MKKFSPAERAGFYKETFPKWPAPRTDDRWLDSIWVLGNNFKGSGFYGAYPPNYVKRVMSLFPDAEKVLHLFSGSLPPGPYVRFDFFGDACRGDAHELSKHFGADSFDLILADPPYTAKDAARYGLPMVRRNVVIRECGKVIQRGGHLVWLDNMLPMFRKAEWNLWGLIGIVRSTNHRFRLASIFERHEDSYD